MKVKLIEKSEIENAKFFDIDEANDFDEITDHLQHSTYNHTVLCRKSTELTHYHFIILNPCDDCRDFGDAKFKQSRFFNNKGNNWVQDTTWHDFYHPEKDFTFEYDDLVHILVKIGKNTHFHYYINMYYLNDEMLLNALTVNHDPDKKIIHNDTFYYTFHSYLDCNNTNNQLSMDVTDSKSDDELNNVPFGEYLKYYEFTKVQIEDKDDIDQRELMLTEIKLNYTQFKRSLEYQKFVNSS